MKKIFISLAIILTTTFCAPVFAHHCGYHAYYSHHSCPVYIVDQEIFEEESQFHDCTEHSLLTQRTINYYSNGTTRTYTTYSILDKNGEIISDSYAEIKHFAHNYDHYFIVKNKKSYKILNEDGTEISKRNYTKMFEVGPNKLMVKSDKKYGIIDLQDNIIVPIKYKKLDRIGEKTFLSKLNGYWGITDYHNNTLIKNDCESITPIFDALLIKRYGKYGLATKDGALILEPNCDKIKKLAEYILVKRNGKYGLYSATGKKITDIKYKKIHLKRNTLQGFINKKWENIYTGDIPL